MSLKFGFEIPRACWENCKKFRIYFFSAPCRYLSLCQYLFFCPCLFIGI